MRRWSVYFGPAFMASVLAVSGCETTANGSRRESGKEVPPPPPIYANMPLNDALTAAVNYGGDTLTDVKRLIKRRHEGLPAAKWLRVQLHENLQSYEHSQLLNAGHLYVSMPVALSPGEFHELVSSGRPLAQQMGWQLAAIKPSKVIAKEIDSELTRALEDGDDDQILIPQMANAVRANKLDSAYTLVRDGLMTKGDEEYAMAMMALRPQEASDDFVAYLAIPPVEELRQLTLSSVSLYTCMAILRHMQEVPPNIGTANFDHLFFYMVSRNPTLVELAQKVIENYVPERTDMLAQALARQPVWVQIAYLEGARRRMNPKQGLLLSELKKATSENDVMQEIEETKF